MVHSLEFSFMITLEANATRESLQISSVCLKNCKSSEFANSHIPNHQKKTVSQRELNKVPFPVNNKANIFYQISEISCQSHAFHFLVGYISWESSWSLFLYHDALLHCRRHKMMKILCTTRTNDERENHAQSPKLFSSRANLIRWKSSQPDETFPKIDIWIFSYSLNCRKHNFGERTLRALNEWFSSDFPLSLFLSDGKEKF